MRDYFEIKPSDSYIKLFKVPEDTTFQVNLSTVNLLVSLALTLDPVSDVREEFGYASALEEFLRDAKHPLHSYYLMLTADDYGREFLCTSIRLTLMEQDFRRSGIDNINSERYNQVLSRYHQQLSYNESLYSQNDVSR